MKFIKYKQVARIALYGFDDLLRGNASACQVSNASALIGVRDWYRNFVEIGSRDSRPYVSDMNQLV
jgi:hypothetical protein